jgi:hypothetical protein
MYTGNGITREFPLPEGNDGSEVYLVSPAGAAVRAKQGDAYAVRDGAVVFSIPPPAGWTIAFQTGPGSTTLAGFGAAPQGLLVIYPDGTIRKLDRDPWELLTEVKAELAEARGLRAEAREAETKAITEIKALAAAASGDLEGRLLGYGARAEDAISAAVNASAASLGETLAVQLREIRNEREAVLRELEESRKYAKTLAEEMLNKLLKLRMDAEEALSGWRGDIESAKTEIQLAMQAAGTLLTAHKEAVDEKAAQVEGRVKFFVQEEERARAELRAMLDEAARAAAAEAGAAEERIAALVEETAERMALRARRGTTLRKRGERDSDE